MRSPGMPEQTIHPRSEANLRLFTGRTLRCARFNTRWLSISTAGLDCDSFLGLRQYWEHRASRGLVALI